MTAIKERDFVQDENGHQFLVLAVNRIGGTAVMDLVLVEGGASVTIFSPPRQFMRTLRLRLGTSGEMNLPHIKFDTSGLLRPFMTI